MPCGSCSWQVSGSGDAGASGWCGLGQAQQQQHRVAQQHMTGMCERVTAVVEDMTTVQHAGLPRVHGTRPASRRTERPGQRSGCGGRASTAQADAVVLVTRRLTSEPHTAAKTNMKTE